MNKQKKVPQMVYNEFMNNEKQLADYLTYVRHKQPHKKIIIDKTNVLTQKNNSNCIHSAKQNRKPSKTPIKVHIYVQEYLKALRQVVSIESIGRKNDKKTEQFSQNYASKKMQKKIIQFLQQFPSMNFLYQVVNEFGKNKTKLSINQIQIMSNVNNEMIPLFQKIIEYIEKLKKDDESKKLMQLGHRIQHLQSVVEGSKKHLPSNDPKMTKIFRTFDPDRIQKYILMEDNIVKAEKRFGNFSETFVKNREVFSNLNRVYQNIKNQLK